MTRVTFNATPVIIDKPTFIAEVKVPITEPKSGMLCHKSYFFLSAKISLSREINFSR